MVLLASDYDQSRFFKAADIDGERKFRIKTVTEEMVGTEKEKKLVVWFTNDAKGLPLNKTNNRVLRGAFGDDTAGWAKKIIIVFTMMVDMHGQIVPGLRVRIPLPKQAATTAAKPSQASGNGQTVTAKPSVRTTNSTTTSSRRRHKALPTNLMTRFRFSSAGKTVVS